MARITGSREPATGSPSQSGRVGVHTSACGERPNPRNREPHGPLAASATETGRAGAPESRFAAAHPAARMPDNMNMKTTLSSLLAVVLFAAVAVSAGAADAAPRMLAHDVYFTLKDRSDAAKQQLVNACQKYLSDHPGTVWFDAAVLASEYAREVNDREFDVALHLLFKDQAAHEAYQTAPKHLQFIEENKDAWAKVRVFDSWVVATAHSQTEAGLPARKAGKAGKKK